MLKKIRNILWYNFDIVVYIIPSLMMLFIYFKRFHQLIFLSEEVTSKNIRIIIFLTILTLIIVTLLISNFIKNRNEPKFWRELARLFKAKTTADRRGNAQIVGALNQYNFRVYTTYKGQKKNVFYTIFSFSCPHEETNNLYIVKRSLFNIFLDRIDIREAHKTGDSFFDKRYIIYTKNPDFANMLFSEEVKRTLNLTYSQFRGELKIEKNKIRYDQRGGINTKKRFRHFYNLTNLARILADSIQEYEKRGGR